VAKVKSLDVLKVKSLDVKTIPLVLFLYVLTGGDLW
jgi:hypothetical protein